MLFLLALLTYTYAIPTCEADSCLFTRAGDGSYWVTSYMQSCKIRFPGPVVKEYGDDNTVMPCYYIESEGLTGQRITRDCNLYYDCREQTEVDVGPLVAAIVLTFLMFMGYITS